MLVNEPAGADDDVPRRALGQLHHESLDLAQLLSISPQDRHPRELLRAVVERLRVDISQTRLRMIHARFLRLEISKICAPSSKDEIDTLSLPCRLIRSTTFRRCDTDVGQRATENRNASGR